MEYEAVIGLEVHAQLKTQTKIFCGCSTRFGAPPNTHTCPVCLGMPGALPVLNKKAVDFAMRMALATGCEIAHESRFDRKNYFYPDLPSGYQISQYWFPIATNGFIEIDINGGRRRIGINRIHLEEDAGKLTHDPDRSYSRVDLNRGGVPLIEIVSEPDLRSPQEAGDYLRKLRSILRYLDICDGNMEEGSFRCDANVSLRPRGTEAFGTRIEIKNLNSFKHVEKALSYEIGRQQEVLAEGGRLVQETRLWDSEDNRTRSMRSKEEALDYRYFPDPDLPPLIIEDVWIEAVRNSLPELPDRKKERFITQYELPAYDAELLSSSHELAAYFEACVGIFPNPKTVSNWVMGPLLALLNSTGKTIVQSPVSAPDLAALLTILEKGVISGKIAKTVFDAMAETGRTAEAIIAEKGLVQVSDASALDEVIAAVLEKFPKEVADYQNGKTRLMGFFMGEVMRATRGKANPKVVGELLGKRLKGE